MMRSIVFPRHWHLPCCSFFSVKQSLWKARNHRVKKIQVEPDFDAWREYAYAKGVHPAVISSEYKTG